MARPSSFGSPTNADRIGDHPLDACVPRGQLVAVERVVEREHGHDVPHRRERGRRRRADLLERRVGGVELGVLVDQRLQLADERVELGVGDLGLVVAVVALAVVPDLRGELVGARRDLGRNCSACSTSGSAGHRPQSTDRV